MSSPSEPNDEPRADTAGERNPAPRIIRSEEIFQGRTEVWIEHGADMYRLRVTAAGRLYLTK